MTDDIVATLLSHVPDEPMRTHYTGCEKFHPTCAMVLAADEIVALRTRIARLEGLP